MKRLLLSTPMLRGILITTLLSARTLVYDMLDQPAAQGIL